MTIVEFLKARLDEDEALAESTRDRLEAKAKRAIVERYAYIHDLHWGDPNNVRSVDEVGYRYMEGQLVVQALAAVYANHPDYSLDWDRR